MDSDTDLGPYNSLSEILNNYKASGFFDCDAFDRIFTKADPVENGDALLVLFEKFKKEMLSNIYVLRLLIGVSVLNVKYGRRDFCKVLCDACKEYEKIIGRNAIISMDLDNLLGVLRLFLDAKYSPDVLVPCLAARMSFISRHDVDSKVILSNHADVFEEIGKNSNINYYAECLYHIIDNIYE